MARSSPDAPDTTAILSDAVPSRGFDFNSAFAWVRAKERKTALRQAFEIFWLTAVRKFAPDEYYLLGLFRRSLGREGRRSFLSEMECNAFNSSLNRKELLTQNPLAKDKMLSGFVFERAGLPVPRLLGHASALFRFGSPQTLTSPDAVCAFLRSPGSLPCFGKPVHGSHALGTASMISVSDDGQMLTLGDGREVLALALAQEILARHGEGYLFQELLTNERSLSEAIGPTVAGVRITTVQTGAGPQVLYATIRAPAPGAMNDATVGGRQVRAAIDAATGKITRAQDMFRMSVIDQETHPVTGAVLPALQLPHWPEAVETVLRAHRIFADNGIIGWDVLLTDRGPVISEANTNPGHSIYQRPHGRGLLNPDLMPLIDEARAHVAARLRQRKAEGWA